MVDAWMPIHDPARTAVSVSSTLLLVIGFPAFYLALEAVRTPVRNAVRRRRNRPEIA